jgi:ABC-2 type transport system ATP-binding protein
MSVTSVIDVRGLTRRFKGKTAVDGLDLDVCRGEVFGFLGHNGAGKTTTVRLLNGILDRDGGSVRVLGLDPATSGPAIRRRSGVLTETPALDERLTARENLRLAGEVFDVPRGKVASRIASLLADFGLSDRADEKTGGYSRGMKQRLALARALLHEPEIVFLDEPTSGLDPVAARHVHDLIARLSHDEGRTVFLCTHNLDEAQRLCDRVAVLERGRILALGSPRDLIARYAARARLAVEVDPADLATASQLLAELVGPVAWTGSVAEVDDVTREMVPAVVSALAGGGVRVYRIAPSEATLEDVYFALHGDPAPAVETTEAKR